MHSSELLIKAIPYPQKKKQNKRNKYKSCQETTNINQTAKLTISNHFNQI